MTKIIIDGKIKQGFRIASGLNLDPPMVSGLKLNNTITLQKPFFIENKIPRIQEVYNGTINLDIAPRIFKILKPDYTVTCQWHPDVLETFWLVDVAIKYKKQLYPAYIYYPRPSSVKSHKDDTVELLAEKIQGLKYGDMVSIIIDAKKVRLV